MLSKQMKRLIGKYFIAILPVISVLAAWTAWYLSFVPLLDAYGDQGIVLEEQLDRLDRKITSGEVTQHDAIRKLKDTLIIFQEADEQFMVTLKLGMIFLFLVVGMGAIVGSIRIIFLELRIDSKNPKS